MPQDAPRHPLSTRLAYGLVQLLLHLALPVGLALMWWRGRREPGYRRGLAQRFGFGTRAPRGAVWIYAASLGETRVASPLIRALRDAGYPVILTHQTPAGLDEGHRLFPADPGILHRYIPLDLFWAVRLFLRRNRPALGIVMEIEIWPAMLLESRRAGVPMVLANGNLLAEAMERITGPRVHLMRLYREFAHVFTRTEDYRARYLHLGLNPARISVVGDLKYDQWIDPAQPAQGRTLRDRWAGAARVLALASTIEDEEAALLAMIARLLAADPGLGVVWVPRSPQRFDPLARRLADSGHPLLRRSALGPGLAGPVPAGTRVILGDSLGEMNAYLAASDLVFVGASLGIMGGHNIIEPLALGKPVVMGPSIYAIAPSAEAAGADGAFESLPDAAALEARIAALMADPAALAAMGARAQAHGGRMGGAAARTLDGLRRFLPPPG